MKIKLMVMMVLMEMMEVFMMMVVVSVVVVMTLMVATKNVNWALERVSGSLHFPGEPAALCQPVAQILDKMN